MALGVTIYDLVREFWRSPDEALFPQHVIAAVRDCSESTLERDRQLGTGIPFLKIGRAVRYRKHDVVAWLGSFPSLTRTSGDPLVYQSSTAARVRRAKTRGGRSA